MASVDQERAVVSEILTREQIGVLLCSDPSVCLDEAQKGAGALCIDEGSLEMTGSEALLEFLHNQPPWSELPVIVLTDSNHPRSGTLLDRAIATVGNVILLESTLNSATLIRSVQVALRSRRRQYQVRDLLAEQVRQQQALRQSEQRYRRIIETAYEGIWEVDSQGRTTYINKRMAHLLGYDASEIMGKIHTSFMWEEDRSKGDTDLEMRKKGTDDVWDQRFRRKDGTELWTVTSASSLYDESGAFQGALGMFTDITDRKRAEAAVRDNEERLRVALEGAALGMWDLDLRTNTSVRSLRHDQIWGYNELQPQWNMENVMRQVLPEDHPTVEQARARAEQVGVLSFEARVRWADGSVHWVALHGKVRYTDELRPVRIIGVVADITERKKAEEALRENERRLALALEGGQTGMWEWHLASNESVWNAKEYELLGLPVGSGRQRADLFLQRVHPRDAEALDRSLKESIDKRKDWLHEFRIIRPDGQVRWLMGAARTVFKANGEPERMVGVNYDITERKEFQAELERLVTERTAKLQELVGELEHFSYTITHDMRAPLRSMRGFAEIAEELSTPPTNSELNTLLRRIITSAERMDLLITDALSYTQAVRQHLPLGPVDVGALLRGMIDTYPEFQISKAHINVDAAMPLVLGNEAGLTQCFSNLLGNAIKFAKPGQTPEIRVWAEVISSWDNSGATAQWIRIWVEDNGIGISQAMLPRVFNLFARASNEHEGTGVGLALVRKVVDRMGGRLGVESTLGVGSRFWLELLKGDPRRPASAILPSTPRRPGAIL